MRLGKDAVAPGEGVDLALTDPASPGGVCGNVDGSATGGNNKQYINCPAGLACCIVALFIAVLIAMDLNLNLYICKYCFVIPYSTVLYCTVL